jgi:hypothetical protein
MKANSTREHGPEFKKKNSEGRSYKHVDGPRSSHGGGDHENEHAAKRAHKTGPRPGTNTSDKQAPHKQVRSKELKHVDQGDILNEWCRGKRGSYK